MCGLLFCLLQTGQKIAQCPSSLFLRLTKVLRYPSVCLAPREPEIAESKYHISSLSAIKFINEALNVRLSPVLPLECDCLPFVRMGLLCT